MVPLTTSFSFVIYTSDIQSIYNRQSISSTTICGNVDSLLCFTIYQQSSTRSVVLTSRAQFKYRISQNTLVILYSTATHITFLIVYFFLFFSLFFLLFISQHFNQSKRRRFPLVIKGINWLSVFFDFIFISLTLYYTFIYYSFFF